jgi:uncharacterized membrane protein
VLESVFTFLFKYAPDLYRRGDVALVVPGGLRFWAILAAVVAGAAALTYASARARTAPRDRLILGALRMGVVALFLVALLRPVLVVSTTVPQRSFVAVLVDDSRSMALPDRDGDPRGLAAAAAFAEGAEVRGALEERFGLRFFAFGRTLERISGPEALVFQASETHLGRALERVREELSGVPLAGIVLVSDGGDNGPGGLSPALLALRGAGVPVFPVVAGDPEPIPDVQVSRVELPGSARRGSSIEADVGVTQTGFAGREVELVVEDRGRIVTTRPLTLPPDGETRSVRVRIDMDDPGPRDLRFRIPVQEEERIDRNNEAAALVVVDERRDRILYVEGEPRHEVAFLRRAVADDPGLELVLLQRSYQERFLRLDVEDADELATGFPRTREELFRYRGIVLGSVEAAFFSPDQLRMLADFVGVRGGGLLTLGGRRALAQGGYVGTAVADVLPVVLELPPGGEERWGELTVLPTRAGATHGMLQLAATEEESAARWEGLPPLSTFNPVSRVKPGATTLLTGRGDAFAGEQVVLAWQRFGRGRSVAFPVWDLWTWRMHADIPLEDLTHETLVRQLLRFTVDGTPDPVTASLPARVVEPGTPAELRVTVRDSAYVEVNGASVRARVIAPDGAESDLALDPSPREDGVYTGFVPTTLEGIHEVEVAASRGGEPLGDAGGFFRAGEPDVEFRDPAVRAGLLRRVAEETGGRLHTLETLDRLPDDITLSGGGIAVDEEFPLWDMPILLLLLLGLLAGEWGFRRLRGLA